MAKKKDTLNAPQQQKADRAAGIKERDKIHENRRQDIAEVTETETKAAAEAAAKKAKQS